MHVSISIHVTIKLRKLHCSRCGHNSHLSNLFNCINEILSKSPTETLTDAEIANVQDYCKQLQQKGMVFTDIDRQIMDHLDNEDELESMVFESEELQRTLSQKFSLPSCQLYSCAL